jgi:hypothetical protein
MAPRREGVPTAMPHAAAAVSPKVKLLGSGAAVGGLKVNVETRDSGGGSDGSGVHGPWSPGGVSTAGSGKSGGSSVSASGLVAAHRSLFERESASVGAQAHANSGVGGAGTSIAWSGGGGGGGGEAKQQAAAAPMVEVEVEEELPEMDERFKVECFCMHA